MKGKIGIEEHFAIDETIQDSSPRFPGDSVWPELKSRLLDIQEKRVGFDLLVCSPDPDPAQLRLFWQNHPNQRRDLP